MTGGRADPARAWQRMLSGRRLDLLHPDPGDIALADIAHGLARVARWNGQTRGAFPFSVAQHSLLVERAVTLLEPAASNGLRLAALLHDAPEYVIGDLISPFKAVMGDAYKAVEHRILLAVHAHVGLPAPEAEPGWAAVIKRADQVAAFREAIDLAGFSAEEAAHTFVQPDAAVAAALGPLTPRSAPEAQAAFLAQAATLMERG